MRHGMLILPVVVHCPHFFGAAARADEIDLGLRNSIDAAAQPLDDLVDPKNLDILHSVFFDPDKLRPKETRAGLTKEAADKFSTIASRLQDRGSPGEVAHFLNQLVFCFFAHSVKLLCRQAGKRFIPLRSASVTSLLATLQAPEVTGLTEAAD